MKQPNSPKHPEFFAQNSKFVKAKMSDEESVNNKQKIKISVALNYFYILCKTLKFILSKLNNAGRMVGDKSQKEFFEK
jgi:hypothetical protein